MSVVELEELLATRGTPRHREEPMRTKPPPGWSEPPGTRFDEATARDAGRRETGEGAMNRLQPSRDPLALVRPPLIVDTGQALPDQHPSDVASSEHPLRLDAWVVPPHTSSRRTHGRGRDQKGQTMTQGLGELVEQFCLYQLKQRGRTKGGVEATRWVLNRFVKFVRAQTGRQARVTDLTVDMIQQWMDDMAANDLSLSSLRTRQATLSSLCAWLVKRDILVSNPVAKMDRPPHRSEPPTQVPSGTLMDTLIDAARRRQRPRDMAIFLILRYSGMRRESVATLRVQHLDETWGLRGVLVKGGKTRDIPLPRAVMEFLWAYVEQVLSPQEPALDADTPLFWSTWGRRRTGKTRQPMTGRTSGGCARCMAG